MTIPQYSLFLHSIEYQGNNIGSSLRFTIKVGGATIKFRRSIKRGSKKTIGSKKVFKVPKQIVVTSLPSNSGSIQVPVTIQVIEKEKIIANNDQGESTAIHEFGIIPGNRYIRIQRVDVEDSEGEQKEVANFYFELVFQINDFSLVEPKPKGPPITPPIVKLPAFGNRSIIFRGICDLKCLIDCNDSPYCLEQCSEGGRTDLKCLPRCNPNFSDCIERCCKHNL